MFGNWRWQKTRKERSPRAFLLKYVIEIKQTTVLVFLGCSCMLSSCLSQHSGSSPSSLSEAEAGLVTSAVSKVRGYSPSTAVYGAWCRKACETRSLETCFPRLLRNILFTREWLKELNSSQERKDLKKTMMGQGLHLGFPWGKGLSGWRVHTEWDSLRTSSGICGTWRMSPRGLLCALE